MHVNKSMIEHEYTNNCNSFKGESFKILGAGTCHFADFINVDLALNTSEHKFAKVRSRLFELPPGEDQCFKDKLKSFEVNGENLIYRAGYRDREVWRFYLQDFSNLEYLNERRCISNPVKVLEKIDNEVEYFPFYNSSLIAALFYAYKTGKSKIELFGFELPHNFKRSDMGYPIMKLRKGENTFTHAYRLCCEMEKRGRRIIFHQPSSLNGVFN